MKVTALPCFRFCKEVEIARKYGFLTFPEFLDNFYVRYVRYKDVNFRKTFLRYFSKFKENVKYVVFPDYQYNMTWLLRKYDNVIWVFPLHRKEEFDFILKHEFEWVGFPHRIVRSNSKLWGNYTLQDYFDFCETYGLKKWYLGFWLEAKPYILLRFDGLDTTLPEYYSGKCGKIWLSWNKAVKPKKPMKTIEIFEQNVRNFKKALEKLKNQKEVFKC